MPLGLALVNMLQGKDVNNWDTAVSLAAADPAYRYLAESHALSPQPPTVKKPRFLPAPFTVETKWMPTYRPRLTLPVADKSLYRVLDYGTAPKEKGSPAMNLLSRTLRDRFPHLQFDFVGVDQMFPYYKLAGNHIGQSVFALSDFQENGRGQVNRVEYRDAHFPKNNVMSDGFAPGRFDFVILCMTLHQLHPAGENA